MHLIFYLYSLLYLEENCNLSCLIFSFLIHCSYEYYEAVIILKIAPVILSGGGSRRMGQDKTTIQLTQDHTMLSRLVTLYQQSFGTVYVSMNEAGRFDPCGGVPLIDLRGDQGPLAGLETALTHLSGQTIFLTAVDLPFGDVGLVHALHQTLGDYDGCYICHENNKAEPLFALYQPSCLQAVSCYLDDGGRSFHGLYDKLNLRAVTPDQLPSFDLHHILTNVNRPEDLVKAKEFLEKSK